jgi:hypothetical protein
MTGARIPSNSDLSSVALPADESATAAVSPAVAVARNSIGFVLSSENEVSALERVWRPELPKRQGEKASAEQEDSCCGDGEVSLRNVVSISTHDTPVGSAPGDVADELIKAFGIAASGALPHSGTPSGPFGATVARNGIGDINSDLEAAISALELSWLRCGIVMNEMAFLTCAASESISNSTSLVKA